MNETIATDEKCHIQLRHEQEIRDELNAEFESKYHRKMLDATENSAAHLNAISDSVDCLGHIHDRLNAIEGYCEFHLRNQPKDTQKKVLDRIYTLLFVVVVLLGVIAFK